MRKSRKLSDWHFFLSYKWNLAVIVRKTHTHTHTQNCSKTFLHEVVIGKFENFSCLQFIYLFFFCALCWRARFFIMHRLALSVHLGSPEEEEKTNHTSSAKIYEVKICNVFFVGIFTSSVRFIPLFSPPVITSGIVLWNLRGSYTHIYIYTHTS